MDSRQPPFFTVEKQRRPSPRPASAEHAAASSTSSSSPSYPSGQGSATTPASGSHGGSTGARGHGGGGGGRAAAASAPSPGSSGRHRPRSARATAVADPTTRTPPPHHPHREPQRHPRSTSAPHTGGDTLLDTTAFASPTSGVGLSVEYGRAMAGLLDSVASPSSTPPRSSSSSPAVAPASARRQPPHAASRAHGVPPPQPQPRHHDIDVASATASPAVAASRAAIAGQQPAHTRDLDDRASPPAYTSHRTTTAAPAAATYRHPAGSAFADADPYTASSTLSGDAETGSERSSAPATDRHGSHWASPSEVLQLRALCQDVVARYQRELDQLRAALQQAQAECAAYARERATVRELQKCYEDGAAAVSRAKAQQSQWTEERALLQLQVEKMVVENQRLQLLLTKRRRLHGQQQPQSPQPQQAAGADAAAARGAASGTRDRVRAAVQAVANANTSRTPSASWPPMPVTTTAGATLTTPTAATTTTTGTTSNSLTFPHLHHDGGRDGGKLSGLVGRGVPGTAEADTSPSALLSPASSSASPEAGPYDARLRAVAGASTGVVVVTADSPLPLVSSPSTAATAASPSAATPATPTTIGGGAAAAAAAAGTLPRRPLGEAGREDDAHASSILTPSLSTNSEAPTSRSAGVSAAGGTGDAGTGTAGTARPQRRPLHAAGADPDDENAQREEGVSTMGEGEFDPSYARGVTDLSSTSAVSSPAPGVVVPATAQNRSRSSGSGSSPDTGESGGDGEARGERRAETGHVRGAAATAVATNSSSSNSSDPTSGALRGGAYAATAGGRARGAPAAPMSGASPSLGSTAAGSGTSASASPSATTTWSLQYLYQLPRTPAEALEEELRMLKELQRLTEENRVLEVRLAQATAMGDLTANQHAQRHLQLSQAHERARHTAAQWELTAKQLESDVRQLRLQCAEAQATVEEVLERAREQQEQHRVRVVELEAGCRAALTDAREEAAVKFGALRRSLREASSAVAAAAPATASGAATAQEVRELRAAAAERQESVTRLQAELHALRTTHAALADAHGALRAEAEMRRLHVEGELASARDMLAEAARTQHEADSRIEVLEAEVERLRAGALASEGCMAAMEERLRLATGELATQQERLDAAAQWEARAVGAEEELQTQQRYYEKEIGVYKTAACALQERHHAAMADLAKRYERLRMRYDGAKVRLATAVSKSGAAALFRGMDKRRTQSAGDGAASPCATDAEAPVNTSGNSVNNTAGASPEAVPHRAVSSFDILQALRSSAQATEQLTRSLNRATSPYRAR